MGVAFWDSSNIVGKNVSLISRIASVPLLSAIYLFSIYLTLAIKIYKSAICSNNRSKYFDDEMKFDDILLGQYYQKPVLMNSTPFNTA